MNDASSFAIHVGTNAPVGWIGLTEGDELYRGADELRELAELCPVATYVIDADGVIVRFNDLAVQIWGSEPDPGDTDEKFFRPHLLYFPGGALLPYKERPMALVLRGAIPMATDVKVVVERPDGARLAVIVNIRPLVNVHGEIEGAINCFYALSPRST